MLYRSGEFDELECGIHAGEKNPARTRHHLRRDCASTEIERWRAHRWTRHGCLPKRTRNPVASRRGRRLLLREPNVSLQRKLLESEGLHVVQRRIENFPARQWLPGRKKRPR